LGNKIHSRILEKIGCVKTGKAIIGVEEQGEVGTSNF